MNPEQETNDLRNKYSDLTRKYESLLARVFQIESSLQAALAQVSEQGQRINNLEGDFDRKSVKDINKFRELTEMNRPST